jgi:hypothetical protein
MLARSRHERSPPCDDRADRGRLVDCNNEPQLLLNALSANDARTLAPSGLWGSNGIPYGPVPT